MDNNIDVSDNFFNTSPVPIEIKKNELNSIKKNNEVISHINEAAFKTGYDEYAFDFEKNKKKLIDDLEKLTNLTVEEFTFLKKWEEMQLLSPYLIGQASTTETKARIWAPTDINNQELTIKEISSLEPIVVVVDDKLERLWTSLRHYCHSAEYNQAPGRFIKFLIVDRITDKVLGICSIASDVISISDRDKYIGWTQENKLKHRMLRHSAIGTTISSTQPFGSNFLGGKLVAALVTSGVVRNEWEFPSVGESHPGKLVGMTTTSLYGRPSMYDGGMKWWKGVGLSKGKIPVKPYEAGYELWHGWLKQHRRDEYYATMTQREGISGPVTGAKMRVLNMIFKACGIRQSDYCHGYERGVYFSCFYENTKEFLCNKITEDELIMKPLFKEDTKSILDWWRPKAIERYKKLKLEGRLNPNKLFYSEMIGMKYEDAKNKFFKAVGK